MAEGNVVVRKHMQRSVPLRVENQVAVPKNASGLRKMDSMLARELFNRDGTPVIWIPCQQMTIGCRSTDCSQMVERTDKLLWLILCTAGFEIDNRVFFKVRAVA